MKIGLGLGITGTGSAGEPPVITATSAPTMAALDDSQTPSDGFTAGSYQSSEGTISSAVVAYLVNGSPQAGTFDLTAGDVVSATETVTDSAANERVFSTGSVVVTPSVALANSVVPAISGTPEIGQTLSVSDGTWTGSASRTYGYQWTRDGANIDGATANTYTLVAADDGADIGCTVTADDGFTTVPADAVAVAVTYAAPVASGALPDRTYDQNTGVQTVDASGDFTGSVGGTWSVSGASASIDQSGVVSIPTSATLSAVTVTVAYANSGGSDSSAFSVTVNAEAPAGDNILLFVAGQSNARVAGNSSATPPTKYTDGSLGNVQILVRDETGTVMEQIAAATFQTYDVTSNADPDNTLTAWGSEAEFIYQLRQAGETRTVYVVKEAVNGQNLFEQWNPATSNDKFDYLEAKAARARALVPAGFGDEYLIWNQGEADANVGAGPSGDGTAADSYNTNFTAWFTALRSRVTSSAFVIVQRIRPLGYDAGDGVTTEAGWPRAWTIREAQIAVPIADGNATTIDTDFIPSNFGLIHPAEPWTEGMGLRSYAAVAGTYDATYGAITDTTPNAFTFTDQTDVTPSSVILSNALLIGGIERRSAVTVSGGEFRTLNSLNGDSVVSDWATSGFVDKFQKIQIRQTASGSTSTATSATVTIGGVSDTWTVTTYASAPSFEAETQAFIDQVSANGGGTIAGADATALNDFYVAAKATTWWSKVIKLYPRLGDEVASRLDLKGQSLSLLDDFADPGDEWVWSAASGWTGGGGAGVGATGGLDMRVNPSTELPQNDATVMVFYSALASGTQTELNAANSTTEVSGSELFLRIVNNGAARYRLNSGGNTSVTSGTLPTDVGMRAIVRSGASAIALHGADGTEIHSATTASATTAENKLHIGNRYGTYSDAQIFGAGAANSALSAAELTSLATIYGDLLTAFAP
ncbi:sialate O-acetylesterase [Salipiger bermudensis]|uniref:sialate O-acetylesterase n=1 Tax=Salipiger bermudensis TaxID=344736 RepID=UPI001C997C3C|nr:sialate O-acetylesterase [Salipiger bermudensis]MBY6005361.1 sialate O-acetylesterase [Salipiger bermudensis]